MSLSLGDITAFSGSQGLTHFPGGPCPSPLCPGTSQGQHVFPGCQIRPCEAGKWDTKGGCTWACASVDTCVCGSESEAITSTVLPRVLLGGAVPQYITSCLTPVPA